MLGWRLEPRVRRECPASASTTSADDGGGYCEGGEETPCNAATLESKNRIEVIARGCKSKYYTRVAKRGVHRWQTIWM